MPAHKINLNNFKRLKIILSIFSNKQWCETRNQLQKDKWEKNTHIGLNNVLLQNQIGQWKNEKITLHK